jgi:hypothetical protein
MKMKEEADLNALYVRTVDVTSGSNALIEVAPEKA